MTDDTQHPLLPHENASSTLVPDNKPARLKRLNDAELDELAKMVEQSKEFTRVLEGIAQGYEPRNEGGK